MFLAPIFHLSADSGRRKRIDINDSSQVQERDLMSLEASSDDRSSHAVRRNAAGRHFTTVISRNARKTFFH